MSLPVFVVPSMSGVKVDETVDLTGDEAWHAVVVRRIRVGQPVALTDGAGLRAVCSVTSAAGRALSASVLEVSSVSAPSPRVVVVQAIPKGDRGELAVAMLTEVGVDVVVPWAAARSVAVWRGERAATSLARWRSSAREAAKQSRRAWFPQVADPASTADVVGLLRDAALCVVLHEPASVSLASLDVPTRGDVVIVVGPEGGISDEELAAFAEVGAESVRLGPTVLRTSTAGVAATAALLTRSICWA